MGKAGERNALTHLRFEPPRKTKEQQYPVAAANEEKERRGSEYQNPTLGKWLTSSKK
jgi:hypothetical protein